MVLKDSLLRALRSMRCICIRPSIWIDPEFYEVKQSTISILVFIETANSSPSATFTVSTDSNSGERSWKVRPWERIYNPITAMFTF